MLELLYSFFPFFWSIKKTVAVTSAWLKRLRKYFAYASWAGIVWIKFNVSRVIFVDKVCFFFERGWTTSRNKHLSLTCDLHSYGKKFHYINPVIIIVHSRCCWVITTLIITFQNNETLRIIKININNVIYAWTFCFSSTCSIYQWVRPHRHHCIEAIF